MKTPAEELRTSNVREATTEGFIVLNSEEKVQNLIVKVQAGRQLPVYGEWFH